MSKVTNKQKIILEKVDPEMTYSLADALEILQSVKSSKFEESVDIAIRLGVDPNKSDQNVRGAVTLPNSLGKQVTVAVLQMVIRLRQPKLLVLSILEWMILLKNLLKKKSQLTSLFQQMQL